MAVNWNDEPYLVMYLGYTEDDYLTKQRAEPYSETGEAGYAQWAADWEALKYKGKSGKRRARYFILPKTEAENLPATLSDWEIEARHIGLKNGVEYNDMVNTMEKYSPGIKKSWTESTRKGVWTTMAQLYDTYRDEVESAGGTPDNIITFTTAIMTSPEAWAKLRAEAAPLVASLRKEARKRKKERRKKRLTTLVAIIAVVATAIFLGPSIIQGASSLVSGGTSALTTLPTTATAGLTSTLTAIGIPSSAAAALTATASNMVAQGFKPDDVATATADVAMNYVPAAGPTQPAPAPSTGLSTPVIIGLAAGGLTLAGLAIWLTTKGPRKNPPDDEFAITQKLVDDINESIKDGRVFWARALFGASLRDNIKGWTQQWVSRLSPDAREVFNEEKTEILTTGRYWKG